jgi:ATP-dependent Clp protease protease subunit
MKRSKIVISALVVGLISLIPVSLLSKSDKDNSGVVVLSKDNVIVLNAEVNGESVGEVIDQAKKLDRDSLFSRIRNGKNKKPIYLFLYTPGGSIQSGLELIEALNGLNRPVNTVTVFSASMGFQIVQNLGERYIMETGVLMSHRAQGQFQGFFGGQKPSQVDSRQRLWEKRLTEMDEKTVERTNGKQTLASYQKAYDPEMWRTGSESVAEGYADKVVKVKCDETLDGVTTKSLDFMGIATVTYDLSDCPLNTSPKNIKISINTTRGVKNVDEFLTQGGAFGSACLQASGTEKDKLCALNTNLTIEKIIEIKHNFKDRYDNIKDHVVPMYW